MRASQDETVDVESIGLKAVLLGWEDWAWTCITSEENASILQVVVPSDGMVISAVDNALKRRVQDGGCGYYGGWCRVVR